MGWMKGRESVDRSKDGRRVEGGLAWAKGEALCVGRQEVGREGARRLEGKEWRAETKRG